MLNFWIPHEIKRFYRPRTQYKGRYCFHMCLSVHICGLGGGTPFPGPGRGVPLPGPGGGGRGYPLPRSRQGGTPFRGPCGGGGGDLSRYRWGVPPPPRPGQIPGGDHAGFTQEDFLVNCDDTDYFKIQTTGWRYMITFHLLRCFGDDDFAGVVGLCTGEEDVRFGPNSADNISPDFSGIFSFSLSLLLVLFLGCSEYCDIVPFGVTSGLIGSSLLLFFLKGSELLLLCLDLWTLSDDWVSESLCRLDLLLLLCFNLPPLCTVSHPSVSWSAKLHKQIFLT